MFFVHLAEVFSRLRRIGLGEHILKESQCQKKGLEPHYLGMSQNSDARKCLFLTKKNRFRASLFWDIPICETSIQRVVFYLKNFPLNGGFKINGCSKPFFRSFFWPCFFLKSQGQKKEFGNPITFETHIQGKILYLLVIGFLFKNRNLLKKNGRHTIVCNEPALAYCDSCISLSAKSLEDHQGWKDAWGYCCIECASCSLYTMWSEKGNLKTMQLSYNIRQTRKQNKKYK